jgi:hypothetical protein
MAVPKGYAGRGTIIAFSATNSNFVPMPQLEKFEKTGTSVEVDQIECLDSPGVNDFPFPVMVKNGNYSASGPYDPQNPGITALQAFLQAMQIIYYTVTLIDGSTFTGQCFVSKFETPKVDVKKANRFDFEVRVYGVEVLTPLGGAAINV